MNLVDKASIIVIMDYSDYDTKMCERLDFIGAVIDTEFSFFAYNYCTRQAINEYKYLLDKELYFG